MESDVLLFRIAGAYRLGARLVIVGGYEGERPRYAAGDAIRIEADGREPLDTHIAAIEIPRAPRLKVIALSLPAELNELDCPIDARVFRAPTP